MTIDELNATLASLGPVDADQKWLDDARAFRKQLCGELFAIKSPIRDNRILGKSINLTLSIKCLDFGLGVLKDQTYDLVTLRLGQLMVARGYQIVGADPQRNFAGTLPWKGSIQEVEDRIADMEARRAAAQAQLDDALMDDDERAKREAEAKERRDALNAMPQRKTRGDGSQYDRYPDGRVVEVTG